MQHRAQVYPGSTPVKLTNRQMAMHLKSDFREKSDIFHEHDFIEPCPSPYRAPGVLVRKANDKLRLDSDYQQLEKQTIKSYSPSVKEKFDTSEGSCFFAIIDLSSGFYHFPMEGTSQNYTAVSIPFRSFKWLRMPMGLTGSPKIF